MTQAKGIQPLLFLAHGSPLNLVYDSQYSKVIKDLGRNWLTRFKPPSSIISISAHWVTDGFQVTAQDNPPQIFDFYGFPKELYQIKYSPPGSAKLAAELGHESSNRLSLSNDWGLDHGTWSVLKLLFPDASIPTIQVSINKNSSVQDYISLGQLFKKYRNNNTLILASGNIVHNLRKINWDFEAPAEPWATHYEDWVLNNLKNKEYSKLANEFLNHEFGRTANPTEEHFIPLLYLLGALEPKDQFELIHKGIQNASISMLSFLFTQ